MVEIEAAFIPKHRANRRAYANRSAYYQVFRTMDYITIHDVGSDGYHARGRDPYWYYRYIAEHSSTENPPSSRKAWHLTIGSKIALQHLRYDEIGLHSGEGVFAGVLNGNTNSIGIEMCRSSDAQTMDKIIDNTAWVCAWLIRNGHVGKPYPECLRTHQSWSGKYCPAVLLNRPNGWNDFVRQVGVYLNNTGGPYIVIAGVHTRLDAAEQQATEINRLSASFNPRVRPATSNGRQVYVVVAAEHERRDLAVAARDWLINRGIDARIKDSPAPPPDKPEKPAPPIDEDVFYRVVVGSYNDRSNADRRLAEAKEKGFSDAFIVAFRRT